MESGRPRRTQNGHTKAHQFFEMPFEPRSRACCWFCAASQQTCHFSSTKGVLGVIKHQCFNAFRTMKTPDMQVHESHLSSGHRLTDGHS